MESPADDAATANPVPAARTLEIPQTAGAYGYVLSANIDSRVAVRAALKAGALGIFVGIIPLLGIILTGALAVFFYRRQSASFMSAALGARLGAAAGVVVFAIKALATVVIILFHAQQQCIDSIVEIARKYGVDTNSPQFQASIHNLFTPLELAEFLVLSVALAAIGGALASVFTRPSYPRI